MAGLPKFAKPDQAAAEHATDFEVPMAPACLRLGKGQAPARLLEGGLRAVERVAEA